MDLWWAGSSAPPFICMIICHPALRDYWMSSAAEKTNLLKKKISMHQDPLPPLPPPPPPPPSQAQPWHECMDAFRHNLFLRSPLRAARRPITVCVNAITAIIAITRMRLIGTRLDGYKREPVLKDAEQRLRHAAQQSARLHPKDAERQTERAQPYG